MRLSGCFEDGQAEPCHACGHGQVRAEVTAPTVGGNFHRGEMRCAATMVVFLKQSTNKMKFLQNFLRCGFPHVFLNGFMIFGSKVSVFDFVTHGFPRYFPVVVVECRLRWWRVRVRLWRWLWLWLLARLSFVLLNGSDHLNHGAIISVTESSDSRIAA